MEQLRKHIEDIILLTDDEFDDIKTFFTLKRIRKNQYLIHEGDEVKYEYLVLSGIYKVFYVDEQGKEYIVQFAQENWWMSDYQAFFKQKNASLYIECPEEGEVLYLPLYGREKLAADHHKMEHFFRVKLTNGYVALQQRIKLFYPSGYFYQKNCGTRNHAGDIWALSQIALQNRSKFQDHIILSISIFFCSLPLQKHFSALLPKRQVLSLSFQPGL